MGGAGAGPENRDKIISRQPRTDNVRLCTVTQLEPYLAVYRVLSAFYVGLWQIGDCNCSGSGGLTKVPYLPRRAPSIL